MRVLYHLMCKEIQVALLDIDEDTASIQRIAEVLRPEYLPVGVPLVHGAPDRRALNDWWRGRAIPASRSGLRRALEVLDVDCAEMLLLKSFALSLSDQYWVNPAARPLAWSAVNFFGNHFSEDVGDALFGRSAVKQPPDLHSPCNTSDGWLKKRWRSADGKRVLIKGGSNPFQQEPINECFATEIHRRLAGAPYVPYTLLWDQGLPYSACECFIGPDTDFVNAYHIYRSEKKPNHVSPYDHFLHRCERLGIPGMGAFVDYLLVTDFLIANTDRHWGNFGAIRTVADLRWSGPAPVFDSGTSLWHDQALIPRDPGQPLPARPFRAFDTEQIQLVSDLEWLNLSALADIGEVLHALLRSSPFLSAERAGDLARAAEGRVRVLAEIRERSAAGARTRGSRKRPRRRDD